jgi:hypothetical protein
MERPGHWEINQEQKFNAYLAGQRAAAAGHGVERRQPRWHPGLSTVMEYSDLLRQVAGGRTMTGNALGFPGGCRL